MSPVLKDAATAIRVGGIASLCGGQTTAIMSDLRITRQHNASPGSCATRVSLGCTLCCSEVALVLSLILHSALKQKPCRTSHLHEGPYQEHHSGRGHSPTGRRPRQILPTRPLAAWCCQRDTMQGRPARQKDSGVQMQCAFIVQLWFSNADIALPLKYDSCIRVSIDKQALLL